MDVQTLEAVLQHVQRQQKAVDELMPVGSKVKQGMNAAYDGLILSLRDSIQHEADIDAEEMCRQEEEQA